MSPRAPSAHWSSRVRLAELALGILTAVGGFVDVSELVFMSQAGSRFGYALIWVVVISTIGIIVYGEMSGRVAAIAKQPVFNLMRHRLGLKLGLITLIASFLSNLITCAAEIGGVALVLQLLTGAPYRLMALAATLAFIATVWVLPFKWIERTYGLLGLFMLFAIGGAAIETCLANAYSLAQFLGWRWGRHCPPKEAPRFTLTWIAVFAGSLVIVLTGVEPIALAEYAVVAAILVLPLTYLPL